MNDEFEKYWFSRLEDKERYEYAKQIWRDGYQAGLRASVEQRMPSEEIEKIKAVLKSRVEPEIYSIVDQIMSATIEYLCSHLQSSAQANTSNKHVNPRDMSIKQENDDISKECVDARDIKLPSYDYFLSMLNHFKNNPTHIAYPFRKPYQSEFYEWLRSEITRLNSGDGNEKNNPAHYVAIDGLCEEKK